MTLTFYKAPIEVSGPIIIHDFVGGSSSLISAHYNLPVLFVIRFIFIV